jgi:hypothetical protein
LADPEFAAQAAVLRNPCDHLHLKIGKIDEPQKLNYLLTDPGKSPFFLMMGFDRSRPYELDAALRQHALTNEIDEVFITIYGAKFNVRCTMPSPNGRNPCTFSCWIFDLGKG